jgi:two-component system NtrC family response regulator
MQRLGALGVRRIDRTHLPRAIRASAQAPSASSAPRSRPDPAADRPAHDERDERDERQEIQNALGATGGNISHAAERLGITRHGLKKRMLRLGMRSPRTADDNAAAADLGERPRKERK